jgi:hypothetical protein
MRVVLEAADLAKILSKHFGTELGGIDIDVKLDPLEIHVRNIGDLPSPQPDTTRATVAEELQAILVAAAEKTVDQPTKSEPVPVDNSPFSYDDLLNPQVSKHVSTSEDPPAKRERLPPLPKLSDFIEDPTDAESGSVHFDDPGPTTSAEIAAARRTKGDA